MNSFRAAQVTRITGVPYQTLDFWATSGFISPSLAAANGTGSQRVYSFLDLATLRVVHELRKGGISTCRLGNVVGFLRQARPCENALRERRLVVAGEHVSLIGRGDLINVFETHARSCLVFVLDFERICKELHEAAEKSEMPRKGPRGTPPHQAH
jgi:DNA-binding transcriptional MerR regulator